MVQEASGIRATDRKRQIDRASQNDFMTAISEVHERPKCHRVWGIGDVRLTELCPLEQSCFVLHPSFMTKS
jgi:hypothetical protein